jgi:phosphate starvation-inducible PhoH-like protein
LNLLIDLFSYKLQLLNERIIELIDIAQKEFGALKTFLKQLRNITQKLKIVARGTTLKAFGEKRD